MGVRGVRSRVAISGLELRRRAIPAASLLALCLAVAPASASAGVSASDRAATHTFLQATYTLDLELRQDAGKANAADSRAAAAIAAECPKVLAGAPGGPSSRSAGNQLTPRARGEADRHEHQYAELTSELESALRAPAFQIYGAALAKFNATVTPLHWSNPAIAVRLKFELELVGAVFDPGGAPDVCADLHAWVASGYETVAAATRTVQTAAEDLIANAPLAGGKTAEALVKPYEGPAEQAIVRRTEALKPLDVLETDGSATRRLHKALGIEEAEGTSTFSKSVAFAHGRTHSGISYEVEAIKGDGPKCRHIISFSVTRTTEFGSSTSDSGSTLRCFSGTKPAAQAQVSCQEGLIQIESNTLAQTRRVRLTLSDGRKIVSGVTPIPVKDGGPAGVYFQTLRGPAPYPVSLAELNDTGRVLRTVSLRAVRKCHRRTSPPTSVVRRIVQGQAPGGRAFFIIGARNPGNAHPRFSLEAEGPAFPSLGAGVAEPQLASTSTSVSTTGAESRPFSLHLSVGCEPHPFALVFGQLQPPGTTVLIATATGPLAPLRQVAFPKSLDATGTLAYGLTEGLPRELVVQSAAGATLLKEDLTAQAKEGGEYCEGYVEPAA